MLNPYARNKRGLVKTIGNLDSEVAKKFNDESDIVKQNQENIKNSANKQIKINKEMNERFNNITK